MSIPSSLLPRLGEIVELAKKGATIDAQERIMELRQVVLELQEQISSLQGQNTELKEKIELSTNLEWEHPYYWLKTANGKEGPFCATCQDSDNKLIRLQGFPNAGFWECKQCHNKYTTDQYKPPQPARMIWR